MASGASQRAAGFLALVCLTSWAAGSLGAGTPATFRVSYNAEVDIPAASCKAHFVEGWTFPYTTGGQTWRDIGLDGDQRVSNVYVTASPGFNVKYQYGWNNGAWRISWYTSTSSLSYTVSYDKDNAIRQCGGNATTGVPGTYTARFATGTWSQQMNALTVTFKLGFVPSAKPTLAVVVNGLTRPVNAQTSVDGSTVTATLNGPLFSNQDAVFTLTYDYGSSPSPTCSCSSSSSTSSGKGGILGGIIAGAVVLIILVSCGIGCLGLCMSTKTTCPCSRCNGRGYLGVGGVLMPPASNGMYRDIPPTGPPPPPGYYDQNTVPGIPYPGIPQTDAKGYPPGTSSGYQYPPLPPAGYPQAPSGYNPTAPGYDPTAPGYNPGYSQAPPGYPPVGPTGYPPQPMYASSPPPGYPGAGYGQYPPPQQQFGAPGMTSPMQPPGATICPQCQGKGTEVRRTVPAWAKVFGAMGIACFLCFCCCSGGGYHQQYGYNSWWNSTHSTSSNFNTVGGNGWSSGGGGNSGGGGGGGDGGGGGG